MAAHRAAASCGLPCQYPTMETTVYIRECCALLMPIIYPRSYGILKLTRPGTRCAIGQNTALRRFLTVGFTWLRFLLTELATERSRFMVFSGVSPFRPPRPAILSFPVEL